MKKIFTLIFLAPISLFAQKIELSLLGGASHVSVMSDKYVKKSSFSPFGSIQAAYRLNSLSFGLRADVFKIKSSYPFHTYNYLTNKEYDIYIADNFYNPATNISLFANYRVNISKSSLYFGVNAGYIFSISNSISYEKYPEGTYVLPLDYFKAGGSANGLTFGFQVGYEYNLSNRIKLKAELSPRYIYSMNVHGEKDNDHEYNTTSIPLSIGVGFSL